MGDIRFRDPYERLRRARDRAHVLSALEDDAVVQALAHASRERDPLLANVLATEAMNRMRRSRIISNHLADAAFVVDEAAIITFVNPAFLALMGGETDDYVGHRLDEALTLENDQGDPIVGTPACPVRQTLEDGHPRDVPAGVSRRGSETVPVHVVVRPVITEGIVDGAVASLRDVRAERAATRLARESSERLSSLFENNPLGVFMLDDQGVVTTVNPAGERMLRSPRSDIEGRHFTAFLEESEIDAAIVRFSAVLQGETRVDDYHLRRSDGSYLLARVTSIPARTDGRIVGMHGLAEDVTPIQEKLRELDDVRRLVESLHATDSLDAAAETALSEGCAATGAQTAGIALATGAEGALQFTHSLPAEALAGFPAAALEPGSPAHDAVREQRTIHLDGRKAIASAYPGLLETTLGRDARSLLAVPLSTGRRPVGALLLLFGSRRPLSQHDETVLGALSQQAAQAIERIRARDALRESHERQRLMVDTCLDAIITMDSQGRVKEWNTAAERVFGHSASTAIGERAIDLILPPRARSREGASLARDLAAGRGPMLGQRVELNAVRADGTEFPMEISIVTLPGHPLMFTAFARDLSQRRARADHARRLANLVENASDAIMSVDEAGLIVDWNHSCEDLFGWTREEMQGQSVDRLIPAGATAAEKEPPRRDTRTARIHKAGHLVPVSLSTYPIHDPSGRLTGTGAIYRDASHEKERDDLNRRARSDLERIVRDRTRHLEQVNADLQTFAAMASHDLRAPLRRVDALVAALHSELESGRVDDVRDIADRIQTENQRAQRLVRDLLSFALAGRAEISPTDVDITKLAEELAPEVDREERGGDVEWVIARGMRARADEGLVRIALRNVMGNARKYAASAGRTAHVTVSARETDGMTIISVADDGPGFPPKEAARLFEPFTRLGSAHGVEGTGLGLATVERILTRHGGEASAKSETGAGAEFTLAFPKAGRTDPARATD